jgi:membrane peptidoglycan carboxypeptidase
MGIEDVRFLHHFGVDLKKMYYSIINLFRSIDFKSDSDTITQQLAREIWFSKSKSPFRKIQEIMRAVRIEERLTKQEILEWYINAMPMAPGMRGLKKAAAYYFGKEPYSLSFQEQLFIAAVWHTPSVYIGNTEQAYPRMRALGDSLYQQGKISLAQAEALANISLQVVSAVPAAVPLGLRQAVWALWPVASCLRQNARIDTQIEPQLQERLETLLLNLRARGDAVFVYAGINGEDVRALAMASADGAKRLQEYTQGLGYAKLYFLPYSEQNTLRSRLIRGMQTQPIGFSAKNVLESSYTLDLLPKGL